MTLAPMSRIHPVGPPWVPTNSTPLAINFDSRVTDHIVRVGVNYKFDLIGATIPFAAS
jgi:hypothetical protein